MAMSKYSSWLFIKCDGFFVTPEISQENPFAANDLPVPLFGWNLPAIEKCRRKLSIKIHHSYSSS